ncbi:MAG: adenosylmethionine--8-amino-7-oxononanoate transaminase [Myxococcales bacterium]|nr:adenosylmethionine--8-amino-7-oxononanoate transaminase [Myxococcales bacterium]
MSGAPTTQATLTRAELVELERRHVWPPYTPRDRHEGQDPLVIAQGEGSHLIDVDGARYIDANSSWWTMALGHRHPRLVAALTAQLGALDHVSAGGATHPQIAQLAAELAKVAPPGLVRTHFSDDGSTAVEAAVKIAVQYWHQAGRPARTEFVALSGAYHGDTMGAMSLASIAAFRGPFAPLLFKTKQLPRIETDWEPAIEALAAYLRDHADRVAALVVEPMCQGSAGMHLYPAAALRAAYELTRQHDVLMIADEVFVGYGRTGAMWGCDHAGVAPDIMCLGKGFTGGMLPMAATMTTARIYDGFDGGLARALMHGHTFCGHALGAAVARETLAIYRDEEIIAGVAPRAALLADAMNTLAAQGLGRNPRALGMIAAIDLGAAGYGGGLGWQVAQAARQRGVYLRPLGDTVYLTPPLNIELSVLRELLAAVADAVATVCAK